MKRILTLLLLLIAGYAGICILLFLRQDGMIFFPAHASEAELIARASREGFQPWRDPSGTLNGWEPKTSTAENILVVFHGNGGMAIDRTWLASLESMAPESRFKLLLFEFPGYGAREGKPSERSFLEAALAAIDGIPTRHRVWLFGESLGTGVASAVAGARPNRISGLVLLTPFDSLASAAASHYPWLPIDLLIRHRFDSARNLKSFAGPVAFIIAENDTVVPARLARKLATDYPGKKRIWEIPGAGHNDGPLLLSDWAEISRFVLGKNSD